MAESYASKSDIRDIENKLVTVYGKLEAVNTNINKVGDRVSIVDDKVGKLDGNVRIVYKEIENLAAEFHDFVSEQVKANRLGQAETRLVKIRQELDKKYGHYDVVRRMTTGILQADDLGIIKKTTISNATEEVMLTTPGYWLAPCLVALAAWINDQPGLAEKALREAIKRDDEKTSLFFTLVCRRAGRKAACLEWAQRYLANQDEEKLDRKTVIVLDAYASGLLGADPEGVVAKQMDKWLNRLSEKPGFVEKQMRQWSDAIELKKPSWGAESYEYLKKYSSTWPQLREVMEGAKLHAEILAYFISIFEQEISAAPVKEQLDEILTKLVSDFDEEELPLRKEEKLEQFVVDFKGDEKLAKQHMVIEQTAFEEEKDFTQLLTDAAMKPESSSSSVATQKLAIALSKRWISDAYNDIVAKNRMNVPHEIDISIDTFHDKTRDGKDEEALLRHFESHVEKEKEVRMAGLGLTGFESCCHIGGAIIAGIGVIMLLAGNILWGIVVIVIGILLIMLHSSYVNELETSRSNLELEFSERLKNGQQIIRALMAEVVDFRREFAECDAESDNVVQLLEEISPEQYIRKLDDSSRRIKV